MTKKWKKKDGKVLMHLIQYKLYAQASVELFMKKFQDVKFYVFMW